MGLSHTVLNFSRKSQIFPSTVYLTLLQRQFFLDLGSTEWPQITRMMGLSGW